MIWAIGSLLAVGSLVTAVHRSHDAPVGAGYPGISAPDVYQDS